MEYSSVPGLIMTRSTVGELGALLLQLGRYAGVARGIVLEIILRARLMAVKAPPHVHHLRVLGNGHFGHIAVTIFAIETRRNVRTMREMHKVRHLCHRYPRETHAGVHRVDHGFEERAGLCFCNLLMASPAFIDGRQTGRRSAQSARVAIQTLDSQPYMQLVSKLDRLLGRLLGLIHPIGGETEQRHYGDYHCYPPHRA